MLRMSSAFDRTRIQGARVCAGGNALRSPENSRMGARIYCLKGDPFFVSIAIIVRPRTNLGRNSMPRRERASKSKKLSDGC